MQNNMISVRKARYRLRAISFIQCTALVLGLVFLTPLPSWSKPVLTPGVPSNSDARSYRKGVVAAAHPLATEAGAVVLENGGNAIDAAAVVQFVLNVVEPTSSGIGGGGFMGVHIANENRTVFIDSREKTPAAGSATMFLKCDPNCNENSSLDRIGSFTERATSGIAVGVPGTLLGVSEALEKWGTISLDEALQPAIKLAKDGFNINARLASLTASSRTTFWPETKAKFRLPDGNPLPEGYLLVQPDLAKTFKMIADHGPVALYTGDIAQAIVAAQERYRTEVGPQGAGRMALQDLEDYYDAGPDIREPVVGDYRGITLKGMGPPSSGGQTVLQILKCLEQFPIGDEAAGFGFGATNTLHVMIESMRLAFASRSVWMGDADFVDLPVDGLISDGYLEPRCDSIELDSVIPNPIDAGDPRPYDPNFASLDSTLKIAAVAQETEGVNTTHFSIVDRWGNAVSYTSTIEGTWGSGITVPGYGFLLNNELTDFNSAPTAKGEPEAEDYNPGANDVASFKRPRSSMSPVMLFKDGNFFAGYGSPGGSTIINSVVNMTLNIIDHGMSVQDAIDAPRLSQTSSSGSASHEEGFDENVLEELRNLGHSVRSGPSVIGSVQAVVVDLKNGQQFGGADSRRAGTVIGLPRKPEKKANRD
jgi:gamma-glutamyltranspeptidase/glutathione hydrolase